MEIPKLKAPCAPNTPHIIKLVGWPPAAITAIPASNWLMCAAADTTHAPVTTFTDDAVAALKGGCAAEIRGEGVGVEKWKFRANVQYEAMMCMSHIWIFIYYCGAPYKVEGVRGWGCKEFWRCSMIAPRLYAPPLTMRKFKLSSVCMFYTI